MRERLVFYIEKFFIYIGGAVCHREAARSLISVSGAEVPFCARCEGLYLGFFIAFLFLAVKKRLGGDKPPGLLFFCAAAAGVTVFIADGASSYLGFRETNNLIRLITGLLCGAPLPALYVLVFNYRPETGGSAPVIKNIFEFLFVLSISFAVGLCAYAGLEGFWFIVSLSACAGEALVLYYVSKIIIKTVSRKPREKIIRALSCFAAALIIILSNAFQAAMIS